MLFIILVLNLLSFGSIFPSMHTPKVSSFSIINHKNIPLNSLHNEEKSAQVTPRNQPYKVVSTSPGSSRAQSFEVNHNNKQAERVDRRLTYSLSDDDEGEEHQKIFQAVEANSLEKRTHEKTSNNPKLSNIVPQKPPLTSPIVENSEMLEKSTRKEKDSNTIFNHTFSTEELKKIIPYNIDTITPNILNNLLELLDEEKWVKVGSLGIKDIILMDSLESTDALILHLNNCYNFLALKDLDGNYLGWIIYKTLKEDDDFLINIDTCFIAKNLTFSKLIEMYKKLEAIGLSLNCKKIVANPIKNKEKDFYKKIGYIQEEDNFLFIKNL